LIVLRQVFETSLFYDRDVLNNIVFKYHFENQDDYKRELHITKIFICIILTLILLMLILCTFVIFLSIYQTYNFEYIDKEILNFDTENLKQYKELNEIKTKRFIFSPFVALFNGNYINFPSKFVDINSNDLNELKFHLNYYNISYNETKSFMKTLLSNNNNRIEEYESLTNDLVQIILKYATENIVSF
jgi:hypothetical protein